MFWKDLVANFLWLQNHFLENWFEPKIIIGNFLWLQNLFLVKKFYPMIFMENLLAETFFGCKIISSGIGLTKKFHPKFLLSNSFYVENFLWLQNHFFRNRCEPKIFSEKMFWKDLVGNFYGCKIISSRIGLNQKLSLTIFYGCKIFSSGKGFIQ